jgi:predicted phosphate transport protein (TIGR00153 family)
MLMFKKEKHVVKLVLEHVEKTAECVQETVDRLKAYVGGNAMESWAADSHVDRLESEADELLREIREMLYSGAYLPTIRGDIYRLMSAVDNISNRAEVCFDFFNEQAPSVPAEYRMEFTSALDLTSECFDALREAIEAFFSSKDKVEKIRKHCRKAGEVESRIDTVREELTKVIFRSPLDLSQKMHISQALLLISSISDTIEDAGDELELISLKSII